MGGCEGKGAKREKTKIRTINKKGRADGLPAFDVSSLVIIIPCFSVLFRGKFYQKRLQFEIKKARPGVAPGFGVRLLATKFSFHRSEKKILPLNVVDPPLEGKMIIVKHLLSLAKLKDSSADEINQAGVDRGALSKEEI